MNNDVAIEAVAKALFEISPASRGAKPWNEQTEYGIYRNTFRRNAEAAIAAASPFFERQELNPRDDLDGK